MAQAESFVRCYALQDLKHAKPAQVSYVPHQWSREALHMPPPLDQWADLDASVDVEQAWAHITGVHVGAIRRKTSFTPVGALV